MILRDFTSNHASNVANIIFKNEFSEENWRQDGAKLSSRVVGIKIIDEDD